MPNVTQAELAKLLGVSRPYVNKLVSKGLLALQPDGKLDYDSAVAAMKAAAAPGPQLRHASAADTPLMQEIRASALDASPEADKEEDTPSLDAQGIPSNYQQARALRERFAAMNERLKYERDIARLVDAEGIGKALQDLIAELRANLDLIPDRAIADQPAEIAHPLRLKIGDEIDAALARVRDRLNSLLDGCPAPESMH